MKHSPPPKIGTLLLALLLMAIGATTSRGADSAPAGWSPQLVLRPLTPQDIKDYGLTGSQIASGLNTVGLGVPVHLETWVSITTTNVTGVTWELVSKPVGSAAELANSPLGSNVPIWAPTDRLVSKVVERKFLRPDVNGQYVVKATITSTTTNAVLTKTINAGHFMGINTCALCHSGGIGAAPNMVTGWSQTKHASKFTRGINGFEGDHYSGNCISCHTVGYDKNTNAVNGGFDDVAASLGWTFPAVLATNNWDAVPKALQNVANIQCENCHGPGSEHAYSLGDTNKISKSVSASNCGQCHNALANHWRNTEWANSKHAITTRYPTGPGRSACVGCHSGVGFIDRMDGLPEASRRTDYEAIACATCHDPHDATNPHQLRNVGPVTLSDNVTVIDKGGNGLLCMNCHKARVDAKTYAENNPASATFGPHHSPVADMLAGANGYTYGKTIPSSAHKDVVTESCVQCHMQSVASTNSYWTKVGGHTFSPSYDGGTPNDPTDDTHLTAACVQCHGPIKDFNLFRQDFDGNGKIEGVQDEIRGLLNQLAVLLPPLGSTNVTITTNYTRAQLKAAYNYNFVREDGSFGIHNLSYAVGLLKASISDLTDDADHDGLSDTWEIANFGSITAYGPGDDPDHDGVSNALEFAAHTNPNNADSDGDGVSDLIELQMGSDPANANDKPGMVVKMYTAGELEFATEVGKTYQVQLVTELNNTWQTVTPNLTGTGGLISQLVSTRYGGAQAFYRVVTVDPGTATAK